MKRCDRVVRLEIGKLPGRTGAIRADPGQHLWQRATKEDAVPDAKKWAEKERWRMEV